MTALVQLDQSDLDTIAASVETLATAITNLPPGTLPAADESGVNQAIVDAQNALAGKVTPPTV